MKSYRNFEKSQNYLHISKKSCTFAPDFENIIIMEVYFSDETIAEVAQTDHPTSRQYRNLPSNVIRAFHKAILYFQKAKDINEIKRINGLRYEALKGDLKGKNSIRLNDQYRAILTEDKDGVIILSVTFEKITNHYV
jgi:plasmid maintenance system killer protein